MKRIMEKIVEKVVKFLKDLGVLILSFIMIFYALAGLALYGLEMNYWCFPIIAIALLVIFASSTRLNGRSIILITLVSVAALILFLLDNPSLTIYDSISLYLYMANCATGFAGIYLTK